MSPKSESSGYRFFFIISLVFGCAGPLLLSELFFLAAASRACSRGLWCGLLIAWLSFLLWSSLLTPALRTCSSHVWSTGSMLGAHGPGSCRTWIFVDQDQSRVYCFSPVNLLLQRSLNLGLGKVLASVSWFSFLTELLSWTSITLPRDSAKLLLFSCQVMSNPL